MPKAQPEPVLRSILRTPGSQSFRSLCYKVTFAHLDTVQTRTEYLGPEDWYNYRLNRFTSNLQELKRKQYSKNPNELLHICKESADIIRIELPEYLNCFWTSLLDVPQKFETLKKGQHCIKHLEDEINLQIQESKKMSGSDKSHQTPPQLSQQPLQPSNVLETPKSNPSVDPELNSSTMMYGDENPNELQRIEDERMKQQEEQMLKLNADFKANLLVEEKSFERKKKELEQQLEELHKSHLNFTEEKEMELSMKRKDVESGIFKPTSSSTPQYGASVRPKTRGTPTTCDLNDKPDMFGKYHSRISRSSRRDNSSDDEDDYYERSPQFRRKRSPSYDRYERRERYERSPDE